MLNIIELCDRQLYVESDRWQCSFGYGDPVKLGMVLEAVDLDEGEKAILLSSTPASSLSRNAWTRISWRKRGWRVAGSEVSDARAERIRYAYECYGGVPVNIDAVQPPKNSCGASSFLAKSNIKTVIAGTGEEMETRHFQDLQEAMSFARDFYAVYAPAIFGFIDVVLDHPLRVGGTGWDKIRQMARK